MMGLDDLPAEKQADTEAFEAPGLCSPVKAIKNERQILRWNALSPIRDRYGNISVSDGGAHRNMLVFPRVFYGIGQIVVQHLRDLVLVCQDLHLATGLLLDVKIRMLMLHRFYTFENAVVDNAGGSPKVIVSRYKPGRFIEFVDELFKTFRVSRRPLEKFLVAAQAFLGHLSFHPADIQYDIREGVSQFMRHEVQDVLPLTLLVPLDGDVMKHDQCVRPPRLTIKPRTANFERALYAAGVLELELEWRLTITGSQGRSDGGAKLAFYLKAFRELPHPGAGQRSIRLIQQPIKRPVGLDDLKFLVQNEHGIVDSRQDIFVKIV